MPTFLDDNDRTADFTVTPEGAPWEPPWYEELPPGEHTLSVEGLADNAGNPPAADASAATFTVRPPVGAMRPPDVLATRQESAVGYGVPNRLGVLRPGYAPPPGLGACCA